MSIDVTITKQCEKLIELKKELSNNLNTQGILATPDEKLNTLVPKVLDIKPLKFTEKGDVDFGDTIVFPDDVENIESNAYAGNAKIKHLVFPHGLKTINYYVFNRCVSIETLDIDCPECILRSNCFGNCTGLKYVRINCKNIERNAIGIESTRNVQQFQLGENVEFCGEGTCTYSKITTLNIPNGVKEIDQHAFRYNEQLETIYIGTGLTKIGSNAFYYCTRVKDIYYRGTEEQWNAIEKGNSWDSSMGDNVGGYTVHFNYTD